MCTHYLHCIHPPTPFPATFPPVVPPLPSTFSALLFSNIVEEKR
jgi:hypothetical protein